MPVEFAAAPSHCDSISQSVEVSGWDADGQFFVEIADLDVSDSGDTIARLCHRVHSGSLVFVRLVHGDGENAREKGHPTANEAHAIDLPDSTGRCRIRLIPCQPRTARHLVTNRRSPASN